MLSTELSLST